MSTPYTPLQLSMLRVAKIDAAGDAVAGATSGYVTNSLIEAGLSIEIEEGTEIIKKAADGSICVNFKDADRIKRANVTLNLCKLDSELIYLLIGGDIFSDAGTTIGMKVPATNDTAPNGVCMELWTKAWDGSSQAAPSFNSSLPSYYHFVLPRVKCQLGDITLNGEDTEIPVNGFSTENTALNIDGPYNDWPTAVTQAGGVDTALGWWVDSSLPTAATGYTTVPAQGS